MRRISNRYLVVLSVVAAATLFGCNKDDDQEPGPDPTPDITVVPQGDATSVPGDAGVPRPGQEAGTPTPDPDAGTPSPSADTGPPPPDLGVPLNIATPTVTRKVAAVQYGSGQAGGVENSCRYKEYPDVCALKEMATRARNQGAALIILPEYAIDQKYYEPVPSIGTNPAVNNAWPNELIIKAMSYHARNLGAHLVFDIHTYEGDTDATRKFYNSQIAFDPEGKVVAVHHKFNLFGGEGESLTAGSDVTTFDTPMGKVGLLICADIYGSPTLLNRLTGLGPAVVAVSSYWTVNGAVNWYSTYADDYNVYAAVANHTHTTGSGGGVYKPDGTAIVEKVATIPHIITAEIP